MYMDKHLKLEIDNPASESDFDGITTPDSLI